MITQSQLYPKLQTLTVEQRQTLAKKVVAYQNESIPMLEQAKTPWTAETISLFDQGLQLVSTLSRARDFVFVVYRYRQERKRLDGFYNLFRQLLDSLMEYGDIAGDKTFAEGGFNGAQYRTTPPSHLVLGSDFMDAQRSGKAGRPPKARNIPSIPAAGVEDMVLKPVGGRDPQFPSVDGRNKHLDSYIDLLPDDLQKEARKMRELYNALRDESVKYETLFFDPNSTQKDRAYHASLLDAAEQRIQNLWARIDVAYAEATGKTVSDSYKQFLDNESLRINSSVKGKAYSEMTRFDIESMTDPEEKETAKTARIERNKKFLRKDDRSDYESHRQNLMDAASELHEWGILLTDTQVQCCLKYGYEVPSDWIEPPVEERRKQAADARNQKRREERAKAREERKAQKAAAKAESPYTTSDDSVSLFA